MAESEARKGPLQTSAPNPTGARGASTDDDVDTAETRKLDRFDMAKFIRASGERTRKISAFVPPPNTQAPRLQRPSRTSGEDEKLAARESIEVYLQPEEMDGELEVDFEDVDDEEARSGGAVAQPPERGEANGAAVAASHPGHEHASVDDAGVNLDLPTVQPRFASPTSLGRVLGTSLMLLAVLIGGIFLLGRLGVL